jgi:8-oxo-dGTP diphosphatase
MLGHSDQDVSIFDEKVRVRVCGLLEEAGKLLLIRHDTIGSAGYLWVPPGGGIEFGESAEKAIQREFLEETGLRIEIVSFLFLFELINSKHHAIELFYRVRQVGGDLQLGCDPEFGAENQIMKEIKFLTFKEINVMDNEILHGIFSEVSSSDKVFDLRGLFSFKD